MGDAAVSYQQRFRDAFWRCYFDMDAAEALYGPPSTPDELAEARSRIAAQAARDAGKGGLF
jgi:hypothetical protein